MSRDGQCEAWCWSWGHANPRNGSRVPRQMQPVRRCSKNGWYDGLTGHVLCNNHVDREELCFTEREALDRRKRSRREDKKVAA